MDPAYLYTITVILAIAIAWMGIRTYSLKQRVIIAESAAVQRVSTIESLQRQKDQAELDRDEAQTLASERQSVIEQQETTLRAFGEQSVIYFKTVGGEFTNHVSITDLASLDFKHGTRLQIISKDEYTQAMTA